ncbi:PREDICTED: centromere protein K, partial [Eurypyga helias]|uniref:centromere protein K n=1 Tax=Eurypyga helias TaxID=54383 RepID=UPI0005284593
ISTNPEVLLRLGKEELQRVRNDLEIMLSTVLLKNGQLDEDLKREQQWYEEQEQTLHTLEEIEEGETQVEQPSITSLNTRAVKELQSKMLKLNEYKEELLNALSGILEDYFPHPQEVGSSKKEEKSTVKPAVELITLHEILETLVNTLISIPHEPYITIDDSFWPPYVEMLLQFGIALRHPEDPNRIRLEAFHQ